MVNIVLYIILCHMILDQIKLYDIIYIILYYILS